MHLKRLVACSFGAPVTADRECRVIEASLPLQDTQDAVDNVSTCVFDFQALNCHA